MQMVTKVNCYWRQLINIDTTFSKELFDCHKLCLVLLLYVFALESGHLPHLANIRIRLS